MRILLLFEIFLICSGSTTPVNHETIVKDLEAVQVISGTIESLINVIQSFSGTNTEKPISKLAPKLDRFFSSLKEELRNDSYVRKSTSTSDYEQVCFCK